MNKNAYTLIELLVVISIVTIISTIAVPSYKNLVKKSNVTNLKSELTNFAMILENQYQVNLVYPTAEGEFTKDKINEPIPRTKYIPDNSVLKNFNIKYETEQICYKLTATGISNSLNNCTITFRSLKPSINTVSDICPGTSPDEQQSETEECK